MLSGLLERREAARGDRRAGDARRNAQTVQTFSAYDLERDGTEALPHNVARVVAGWKARPAGAVWGQGAG